MVVTDFLLKDIPEDDEKEADRLISVYNTLADKPETVAEYLVEKILKNNKNGNRIAWLTNAKAAWRFSTAKITKRKIIDK